MAQTELKIFLKIQLVIANDWNRPRIELCTNWTREQDMWIVCVRLQWHFEYCYARFEFVDLAQGRAVTRRGAWPPKKRERERETEGTNKRTAKGRTVNGCFEVVQLSLSKLFFAELGLQVAKCDKMR